MKDILRPPTFDFFRTKDGNMEPSPIDITIKSKLEEKQLFKTSRFKEVIKRTRPHKHGAITFSQSSL